MESRGFAAEVLKGALERFLLEPTAERTLADARLIGGLVERPAGHESDERPFLLGVQLGLFFQMSGLLGSRSRAV